LKSTINSLDIPAFPVLVLCLPLQVLWNAEERLRSPTFCDLHNGGDKLLQEAGDLEKGWPKAVHEIDE
jgi:hypothetical protein